MSRTSSMTRAVAVLAIGLSGCSAHTPGSADAIPEAMFRLCNRTPDGGGIGLDYRNLEGHISDYGSPVMTCGTSSPCISFPLLLSVPPSLPEPGKTLQWRDGG